ncbi:MAG: metalloprotease PmbA [Acidiferrobacteraceae bacterium]|nr:metalloprotease PmbA [Acidiferrobacteraceae bacterium]|tara:strand:+ start:1572 stop:2933 length:1362 start_codon:yes stop_codon:yes gene_type:complete
MNESRLIETVEHAANDSKPLIATTEFALQEAIRKGASQAEAVATLSQGLSVSVRMGSLETVEHTRDRGLAVTVYFGDCSGSASTSDYSRSSVEETVQAACTIARFTEADLCNGLAEADRLATEFPDLDLYHPWNLSVNEGKKLAEQCEAAALDFDSRIENSEGATVDSSESGEVYGNSHGFLGYSQKSRHGISCSVIGKSQGSMQRDYWYSASRKLDDLDNVEQIGRTAGSRVVRRLGARKLKTCQAPVLFEAPVASSLLSHFIGAISGGALYRKASFLLNHLGKRIFPEFVRIHEQPFLSRAMGSASFDNEGVVPMERDIVSDGILQGYVLGSYSARRLGLETTGNSGGVHNLTIDSGEQELAGLISGLDRGLFVTELIGFGVNTVTGDYSRGAAGFWIENGEIQFPVEELTIAGNLREMFESIVAIGCDIDTRRNIRCGSILVDKLTIAGE